MCTDNINSKMVQGLRLKYLTFHTLVKIVITPMSDRQHTEYFFFSFFPFGNGVLVTEGAQN